MKQAKVISQQGFTLLEVLVALAVLALAMGAIIKTVSNNTRNAAYLQEKTFAHWVAVNRLVEVQLEKEWPPIGTTTGSQEMAGYEWYWLMKVEETPDKDVRRVNISVRTSLPDMDEPIASIVGYSGRTER
mmetsp:Transcript_6281/g.3524  ORF Transcript_6281/g.3524 Transcript_6281/m.3524 type:complete len:130 (+) Transcript_6281:1100-1489(+)